ncbi:MAG: hypothetical protein PHX09_03050 [Clostridia bacterium]|nr:hypothetical protein [Clostridia bacterium]MDD4685757.1 hypothetical protein [Clostridia bacterium]
MLIKVETDVFFISERLREIDKDYFIIFNSKTQGFEIHHKGQIMNTFCLNVPYRTLDARTLELVQKTRIENIKNITDNLDNENIKTEELLNNQTLNVARDMLKQIAK